MAKKYSAQDVARMVVETDNEVDISDASDYNDSYSEFNSSSACSDSFDSEEEDAGCVWIDEVAEYCSPMQDSSSTPGTPYLNNNNNNNNNSSEGQKQ